MPSSPSTDSGHGIFTAAVPSRDTGAEGFVSLLRTQGEVDALCKKYGVPKEFTSRPAGDRRANSTPPPGAICVYARALEAGMRVPLHGFFRETLAHFGMAPAQLTPNGWRIMAGFLVLCHSASVPPSLVVFRRFFTLCNVSYKHKNGWYFFRPRRDSPGLRFAGLPNPNSISLKAWKHEFFFLSSPELWPCAVEWGEPSKSSLTNPVLTDEDNKLAVKFLRAQGGAAIDLKTYICNSKLAAAMIATASPSWPPPPTSTTSNFKDMDPSVYDMMKVLLAEKAAAQAYASASAKKVEAETGSNAQASASAKKRIREEANGEEVSPLSVHNRPLSSVCSPPPGFPQKWQHFPSRQDGEAARELLQGAVAPPPEPSDVVASSYAAIPQAANYVLELEEKLVARERDAAALCEQLEEAKNELASAKLAADAEREKARSKLATARAELEKTKAELAAAERAVEADVVKTKAELAVAKQAAEAEVVRTKAELAAARAEVVKTKAELAAAKRSAEAEAVKAKAELTAAKRAAEVELVKAKAKLAAAEAERESAKAATVQQLRASEEHVRRRAEQALEGYERWRGRHAPAGRAA